MVPKHREDEERLIADIITLAHQYVGYGYREVAALLRDTGMLVNDKQVAAFALISDSRQHPALDRARWIALSECRHAVG